MVVPGLMGFCLYCVYNTIEDRTLYGGGAGKAAVFKMIYNYLTGREKEVIDAVKKEGSFRPSSWFPDEVKLAEGYISHGVKMGEGWLLTAEIVSSWSMRGSKTSSAPSPSAACPTTSSARG